MSRAPLVWVRQLMYSSYATIDWIHDQIKESSRVKRLRTAAKRSRGGAVRNSWDRFQGWFVVTIVGEYICSPPGQS